MHKFAHTLKALFLDMDETLCDTTKANNLALADMASKAQELINPSFDGNTFSKAYLSGIYRELSPSYQKKLLPVTHEESFRHQLIQLILTDMGETLEEEHSLAIARLLQDTFDSARTQYFDFFEGIEAWLKRMRQQYKLVVITNGPEFSQVTKVERVNLSQHVDHIIIGGQEPAQKPDKSIFEKALKLCALNADEVIHIGDSLSADIQGAINAGIHSIWIQHGQDPQADIQADWVIKTPLDLEALLDNITEVNE